MEDRPPVEIQLAQDGNNRDTFVAASVRVGGLLEIGEPERTYTVEPVEDPVPRELPAQPAEPPSLT